MLETIQKGDFTGFCISGHIVVVSSIPIRQKLIIVPTGRTGGGITPPPIMSESLLSLELLLLTEQAGDAMLPAAVAKVAVETARAAVRPAALPASVAAEATATEATS